MLTEHPAQAVAQSCPGPVKQTGVHSVELSGTDMWSPENASAKHSFIMRLARRFHAARRGNIAVMTAVLMMPIMGLMGLAVDYANAVFVKSRLDQAAQAAATAAATAARNWVQSANRSSANFNQNAVDADAVAEGQDIGVKIFKAQFGDISNGTWNSPTVSVARVSNTFSAQVVYSATLNTYFARIWPINLNTFNLKGQRTIIIGMVDPPAPSSGANTNNVIDEKWNAVDTAVQTSDSTKPVINDWYSGTPGSVSPLNPSDGSLRNGAQAPPPSAFIQVGGALNGLSVAPIISKKIYLEAGNYELRYWYKSTVVYPDYEPVYICGSVEGEMHWATATATRSLASSWGSSTTIAGAQTARAGAYLVPILNNPQLATTPPTAGRNASLPNDFPQPPALPWSASNKRPDNAANRVDICTYSSRWIQRSIPLSVTNAGYFWLSFVAEPPTTTTTINGFYLGRVQLCQPTCSESLNINWYWTNQTTLFTADLSTLVPNQTFVTSTGSFGRGASYEKTPLWITRVFGGLGANPADSQPLFVAQQNDKPRVGSNLMITSQRSGSYLYRGLLLTPGTYRATFTVGATSANPGGPNSYCLDGVSNSPGCVCFVGSIDTAITHGDQIATTGLTTTSLDRATASSVTRAYGGAYSYLGGGGGSGSGSGSGSGGSGSGGSGSGGIDDGGSDDGGSGGSSIGSVDAPSVGYILGNCLNGSNPKTFTYCFLVPRTQYYGVNFRTAGPMLDTNPASLAASPYPELRQNPPDLSLGTGGARVYSLTIDVLSQGVQNSLNNDFPTYLRDCNQSISGNTTPSIANVMASGTPVWPGFVVDSSVYSKPPVRVAVTAPLQ